MNDTSKSEKTIKKDIKFFDIICENSFYINDKNKKNPVVQAFESTFNHTNKLYDYTFKKVEYKFEIEEITDTYIFGWFIKVDNSITNPASQSQLRNKTTGKRTPVIFSDDSDLERYTFFMCDFKNNRMSAIVTRYTNKLAEVLSDYLYNKSAIPTSIVLIKHENIKEKAAELKLVNRVYFSKEEDGAFKTLGEINSENVESYDIVMNIKATKKGLFSDIDISSYKKYKIEGITTADEEVIIDLLEKTLAKTKSIEYSYDNGPNVIEIKEILKNELQALEKEMWRV